MKRILLITSAILLNTLTTDSMAAASAAMDCGEPTGILRPSTKVNASSKHVRFSDQKDMETDSCGSADGSSVSSASSISVASDEPTLPTVDQLFDAFIHGRCSEELFWKTLNNTEFDIRGWELYQDAPIIKAIYTDSRLLSAGLVAKLFEIEASIVDDTTARQESVFYAILASRRNEEEKDILLTAALSALKKDWAYSTPKERAKFLEDRKVQAMIDATGSRRLVWTYALFLASEKH